MKVAFLFILGFADAWALSLSVRSRVAPLFTFSRAAFGALDRLPLTGESFGPEPLRNSPFGFMGFIDAEP